MAERAEQEPSDNAGEAVEVTAGLSKGARTSPPGSLFEAVGRVPRTEKNQPNVDTVSSWTAEIHYQQ